METKKPKFPKSNFHNGPDFDSEFVNGTYTNKGFEDTEGDQNAVNENEEKKKEENKEIPVGFLSLFRYASPCDRIMLIIGTIIAIASGASMPAVMILFGDILDKLVIYDLVQKNLTNLTMTTEEFLHETSIVCTSIAGVGVAFLVCNYIFVSVFSLAAANQAFKIRCLFMASVLKQDVGWYDTNETGDFASRITGDLSKVQDGLGEKVAICLNFLSSTIFCVACGLWYGWKLALVLLSVTPVLSIAMAVISKIQTSVAREEMDSYGKAGAVAEEVLSAIRTVLAFGGEKKEIQRYESFLIPAKRDAIKRGMMTGIGTGLTWVCAFSGYALAFWYGVQLIIAGIGQAKPEYTGGTLIIVFFNIISASMYIGQAAAYFEAFALARGAAAKLYSIIDREPSIDSSSEEGLKPEPLKGIIQLRDVHFNYPARLSVPILRGVSLDIQPGETVALVGPSGCGKSTIIQLILRFYDTLDGSVLIDDSNVKDLNVGWLRDNIGLVGQEPVLFSTTIAENIKHGKLNATQEEVEAAAKVANVHDFINALPLKYNTLVGERGAQLSGGQKQRIAIARALIKSPKILLLDEATSALDTESESVVQDALDKAREGRTTVVVAHRLSTIRTADKIVVLAGGEVQETGTHNELMDKKGLYFELVQTQSTPDEEEEEDSDDPDEDLPDFDRRISVLSAVSWGSGSTLPSGYPPYQRKMSSAGGSIQYHRRFLTNGGHRRQSSVFSALGRNFSVISVERNALEDDEELLRKVSPSQKRLWAMAAKEWPFILIGGISAILMGIHFPAFGVIFGDILGILSYDPNNLDKIREATVFYSLLFCLIAITSGLCSFLQVFLFTVAGEKMTSKLRKMVFSTIITQDVEFFDHPENNVGSLCSRLTSDASSVQGATGSRISMLLQSMSALVSSIAMALFYSWKIGLLVLSFFPIMLAAIYFENRVVKHHSTSDSKGTEEASRIAIEVIESIRTVASLRQEKTFFFQFKNALIEPHRLSRKMSHIRGFVYGLAQSLKSFGYAATFFYGSILVSQGELNFSNLLKVIEGVLVGLTMAAQSVAFAPDYQKAQVAAVRIFQILDLKPKIDVFSQTGLKMVDIKGNIKFENAYFKYPSRRNVRILRGLNMKVKAGKTVALVGSSGCGKSTCVQLVERFYDTQKGSVYLDDKNVAEVNVANLRSHIGLVSQEPVLFSYSIAENIAYGDNSRKVDISEIITAARQANIHNFITSLPQGYDTPVGDRGTQLSGGQKQRVAIARALLRDPKILLLDEATSALDAESEKVVQEALDKARSGRTCLVIAHRLTTIQNADAIIVIHRGKIVEQGTHQELLNKRGRYYNLHNVQSYIQ